MTNYTPPSSSSSFGPPPEGSNRILMLIASFFVPIVGIILGIMYMQRPDEASKKFGRDALVAAISVIVLFFLCFGCYFIFVFGMTFIPLLLVPAGLNSGGALLPLLVSAVL